MLIVFPQCAATSYSISACDVGARLTYFNALRMGLAHDHEILIFSTLYTYRAIYVQHILRMAAGGQSS